jgi:hypothetical protein
MAVTFGNGQPEARYLVADDNLTASDQRSNSLRKDHRQADGLSAIARQ